MENKETEMVVGHFWKCVEGNYCWRSRGKDLLDGFFKTLNSFPKEMGLFPTLITTVSMEFNK